MNQNALEPCARAGEANKSAAAQLRRALEIENSQLLAEREVIERLARKLRLASPFAQDLVPARTFSQRHALVRQVWNLKKQIALLLVELRHPPLKIDNLFANLLN